MWSSSRERTGPSPVTVHKTFLFILFGQLGLLINSWQGYGLTGLDGTLVESQPQCPLQVSAGKREMKVAQLCPTLCDPMDRVTWQPCQILQARILKWVAVPFSRGSFQPGDLTQVSSTAGRFFTISATREALCLPII